MANAHLKALCERGVQYVEVRCPDINPAYQPVSISETTRFLDTFLYIVPYRTARQPIALKVKKKPPTLLPP